ncbi:7-dehydrosterol-delta 7-reductase [Penicillium cataractarum]|uniref:7-dehydrocholesterol reductase n=1 Tax=Penicillium cataractarum TaxID=2100454 RepID=A0A9W9V4A0_9EURO|nr:7-dehydrosterol-delta 7-reductase [Penicillium cataractarum]KAJ5368172.1 7-dehydrosterol-delta 7-reductase [Penicillium cataractarum]
MEVIDPTIIARKWGTLIAIFNIYGILLAAVFYIKAHLYPTHEGDRRFSSSPFYDFYMGVELNPRIFNQHWDVKLFHNGRPGIIGWALIDLSFMALQYRNYGFVTNSMIITLVLHMLYIGDFFHHEEWYLRTIDIAHDHFGFYLAWGSAAFLPTMYTLQAQYLARSPLELEPISAALILGLGIGGYAIFRSSNNQKDNRTGRHIKQFFYAQDGGDFRDTPII